MNEDLKRNKDKALMLFTKVYIYYTNTKKPWDKLSPNEMNKKGFQWYCVKWFFMSKNELTEADVKEHLSTCPELKESADDVLKNCVSVDKNWKHKAKWVTIYESVPLRDAHELKLIINTIGLRMLHFATN